MFNKENIVTIDGPSGVGKSTLSRSVAAALGYVYLDTGAMYRAVGLHILQSGVDENNTDELGENLQNLSLELKPARDDGGDVQVFLCGKDVSEEIRTPEMAMVASRVSALPLVREKLTEMQREIGKKGGIVAEGRDTGTVVFPGAAYKFFLDASPKERTNRRVGQLEAQGKQVDEKELYEMILQRDRNDRERTIAPLKKADDAYLIDTSAIGVEDVRNLMLEKIREKKLL